MEAQNIENTEPKPVSKINWANYNFPPCLRIVHFSISELHGALKRFVLCVYISFLIIIAVLILNSICPIMISFLYNNCCLKIYKQH